MFNRFLLSAFATFVLWGGATDPLCGQEEPSDLDRIQGTWQLVSGEKGGTAFPEELVKSIQLLFSAETMTTKSGSNAFPFPYQLIAGTKGLRDSCERQIEGESVRLAFRGKQTR